MAVLAIKTEPRCKLCVHPERAALDAWQEKRSRGLSDENGHRVNLAYVLERYAELGVENPNEDNIKNHWKKHCQMVEEQTAATQDEAKGAALAELRAKLASGEPVQVDDVLDTIIRVGMVGLEARVLLEGLEKSGITIDHVLKAAAEKTKRKDDDSRNELMRSLGRGVEMVFEKALAGGEQVPGLPVLEQPALEAPVAG